MTKQFHNATVSSVAGLHHLSSEALPAIDKTNKPSRILRMKHLIERTNLSRATLYVLMSKDASFPRKIKLTERSIGFLESEVDAWISKRAQMRAVAA